MHLNYIYIYVYYVSSPYLLVFGDDRVCGTREQMMLQVDLVRRRLRTWASRGKYIIVLLFKDLMNL